MNVAQKSFQRSLSFTLTLVFASPVAFLAGCDDPDPSAAAPEVTDAAFLDEVEAHAAPSDGADETVMELAAATPTSEAKFPCRILALGDSITWGWNGNAAQQLDPSGNFLGGYRSHLVYGFAVTPSATVGNILMVGVRQDNSPPWLVWWGQSWHAGAPGFTNAQLATAVAQGATNVNPDIILLHAGTNDIISGPAPKAANAITALNGLLGQLYSKNPGSTVLLAKIVPLVGPLNAEVALYNAQLDAVAASRRAIGHTVWTVDQNTAFPVQTLEDGVHPNWTGYANMAYRWRAALDAVGCW